MDLIQTSPISAGVYYAVIRDIKVQERQNKNGKYKEYTYYILMEFEDKTVVITPKVFRSSYTNCSYNLLLKNLRRCFGTSDIDIMEHRGMDIAVEISLNYSNNREFPNILWYMPLEEYNIQCATEEAQYED